MTSLYIAANQVYNIIMESSNNDANIARQLYDESYDAALNGMNKEERNYIHLLFNEVWKMLSETFRTQDWPIFDTSLHI